MAFKVLKIVLSKRNEAPEHQIGLKREKYKGMDQGFRVRNTLTMLQVE